MHIYNRIRDLREDNDLTQKDIATILSMHTTQYQRYENGQVTPPFDFIISLADYYNVSIDYIAGRSQIKRLSNDNTISNKYALLSAQQRDLINKLIIELLN